ncbi:LutC/YkgG family protein [Actinokineospora iranica]|uniref:L-lactate dehydrogenase complex protein LldG n=1 Tax=Actinokineospora iranica TaxID=1271860 RepID=A0A1G6X0Y1_9PSEU|nr:lactate utilization protein C [Actinokineospora iranica]SDD71778.1 L-lactate dehydrogenase complex protein LldG [Actinokineospora iranica]
MSARAEILARIRTALGETREPVAVPRDYHRDAGDIDVVALFQERAADYRAVVRRVAEVELPAAISDALRTAKARAVVVPPDLPAAWVSEVEGETRRDEPALSVADLDSVDAVLTGCAVAIAETGTVILDAGPGQGRRALTLVPDVHLCVVRAAQIVGTVPQAVEAVDGARPLTWISGPSATSDIELHRVEGVHGPRNLVILIAE